MENRHHRCRQTAVSLWFCLKSLPTGTKYEPGIVFSLTATTICPKTCVVSMLCNKALVSPLPKCRINGIMIYGKLKAETTWVCLTRSGWKSWKASELSPEMCRLPFLVALVLLISNELKTRKEVLEWPLKIREEFHLSAIFLLPSGLIRFIELETSKCY